MDWHLAGSVFVVNFLGELPDKTALAVLFLATHHNVFGVFAGAAGAFAIQSVIAVTLGTVLLHLVPPQIIHMVSGALFLVFAVWMWIKKAEMDGELLHMKQGHTHSFIRSAMTAFGVIFVAEWGDITQMATATFAAKYHAPVLIGFAATLALWTVTGFTVAVGHYAKTFIPQKVFRKFAAVAFALVGIVLLVRG
jgi:putative Ca2+/H+ antiporter (TMEM165/GDT1 family)